MTRVTDEALEDLLARLARSGYNAHARAVRMGVRQYGPCTVQIPGGSITVRHPTGPREGREGSLVAVVTWDETDPRGTTIIKATATDADANPRRSIRLSDEVWRELAASGDPSVVARDLIEEGLARKRDAGARRQLAAAREKK